MKTNKIFLIVGLSFVVASAQAGTGSGGQAHMGHGSMNHGKMDHSAMNHGSTAAGEAGKEADVSKTVDVETTDKMRFIHEPLHVQAGDTIKFDITNTGRIRHEFAIGLTHEHAESQKMMRKMPNMVHDMAHAVTLEPGETKTVIWKFTKAGDIEVACNIPGHYQAGMKSAVMVH